MTAMERQGQAHDDAVDALARVGWAVDAAMVELNETFAELQRQGAEPACAREPHEYVGALERIAELQDMLTAVTALTVTQAEAGEVAHALDAEDKVRYRRAVTSELGVVLRKSPAQMSALMSTSRCLVTQMPRMLDNLAKGRVSTDIAQCVARQTHELSAGVALEVDAMLDWQLNIVGDAGTMRWKHETRTLIQHFDPAGDEDRARKAYASRYVAVRDREDGMSLLLAKLRTTDAQAIMAELQGRSAGVKESRRSAAEADALVQAILGGMQDLMWESPETAAIARAAAGTQAGRGASRGAKRGRGSRTAGGQQGQPAQGPDGHSGTATTSRTVEIGILIDASHLLPEVPGAPPPASQPRDLTESPPREPDNSSPPTSAHPPTRPALASNGGAFLPGHGVIDPGAARDLILDEWERGSRLTYRRIYAAPDSGELVAMDSRARAFPDGLAQLIAYRDGWCRAPYCNARIRNIDHIRRYADGGATSLDNGQGLCQRCNLAKEDMDDVRVVTGAVALTNANSAPEAVDAADAADAAAVRGTTGSASDKDPVPGSATVWTTKARRTRTTRPLRHLAHPTAQIPGLDSADEGSAAA